MIALIIIGAVALLITILLLLPLVFVIDYDKEAEIKVRLLFFDLFKEKDHKKKIKKRLKKRLKVHKKSKGITLSPMKSAAPPQETAEQTRITTPPNVQKKKEFKKDIPDLDIKTVKMLLGSLAHPFKQLIRKIKISELNIESIVGGSDAAMAALNFGLQNGAIYSALAWLDSIANLKVERVHIQPDFMREDSVFKLHCKVKIKIGTVIACALAFMVKYAKYKEYNGKPPKKEYSPPRSGGVGKTIRIVMD